MKIYKDQNGEHQFDDSGKYRGYHNYKAPDAYKTAMPPFDSWDTWTQERHLFLVETLGFACTDKQVDNEKN